MIERYQGANRGRLVEALADQELVRHDMAIAREFADHASLQELQKGKQLYLLGEPGKNVLYFILSGSVGLLNLDKQVTTLKPGQCIGEFPILDSSLSYTVTAEAREQSVVASLPEGKFLSIAASHPEIWKNTARMLVTRLRGTSASGPGLPSVLRPGDLTIVQVWRSLTVGQFWGVIVACCSTLATVAGVAYKLGSAAR
jgi:CRP-like cAMP-binding protein